MRGPNDWIFLTVSIGVAGILIVRPEWVLTVCSAVLDVFDGVLRWMR